MHSSSLQLLKFDHISKSFGPKRLFEDLSLTVSRGEKIALVGENGSGKTTLARLAAKLEFPDLGIIEHAKGCALGYLPQANDEDNGEFLSLKEFFLNSQKLLADLLAEMKSLEIRMAEPLAKEEQQRAMQKWDDHHSRFVSLDGYALEEKAKECLSELGAKTICLERPFSSLSGGEKRKARLAALLLQPHDLMILDEPTNHLEKSARLWLQKALGNTESGVLLISHDRAFLNGVANRIAELLPPPEGISFYFGNYDDYASSKEREQARKFEAYRRQKEEMADLCQTLKAETHCRKKPPPCKDNNKMAYDRRGEKHMRSKQRTIQQTKSKLLELERNKLKNPIPKDFTGVSFIPSPFETRVFISIENITVKVEDKVLLAGLDLEVRPGSRIILEGPNGCGKSTLLRLLAKNLQPECGKVAMSPQSVIGHLAQEPSFQGCNETLVELLQNRFSLSEEELHSFLKRIGLVSGNFIKQPLSVLSLGQQRRFQLLELMLCRPNVLLLDEPTNHLAPHVIEKLEEALLTFPGAIIAATHDQRFAERVGNSFLRW